MNRAAPVASILLALPRLRIAANFWRRLCGLWTVGALPADAGLLLLPCRSIHTAFLRFPIDVVFLDASGRVLKRVPAVAPWRTARCAEAYATLELATGNAATLGLHPGVQLPPPDSWAAASRRAHAKLAARP